MNTKQILIGAMHKLKKYLLFFFLSLILCVLNVPFRGDSIKMFGLMGFPLSLLVGCISFFMFTLLSLSKYRGNVSKNGVFLAILLGIVILEVVPLRIISFKSTLISLPETFFRMTSIIIAYGVYRIKNIFCKTAVSVLFFALCLWVSIFGYGYWIHKLSFGSFTGKTEQIMSTPFVFQDNGNKNISLSDIDSKYVVLDFWASSCGVCFKKFPEVQRIHEEWNDTQIRVYGVFCRNEKRNETHATGTEMLRERGYTFPSLSIDYKDPVLKEMGVERLPTVLIFDQDRTLIYRGNIEGAERYLKKL